MPAEHGTGFSKNPWFKVLTFFVAENGTAIAKYIPGKKCRQLERLYEKWQDFHALWSDFIQ